MGPLSTYFKLRMANPQVQLPGEAPVVMPYNNQQQQPQQQQTAQQQVDTSDPINSLAGMLVTPAEREAREQKMQENKRKMIAWTGLFDGLRQLGNLYYTAQGATPQQFTDKPYQQIEANYQAEANRQDALDKNRENYVKQLWSLQRQGVEDARKKALTDAQVKYYGSRDEMAQRKQELAEFKAQTDADYKKATLEQKNAINEVRMRLLEGQINKTEAERQYRLIMMGNAQRGTETIVKKPDGSVTQTIKKPAGSGGSSSGAGKYNKYKKGSSGKYDKYKKPKK